jgi:hypothetical protein
LNLCINGGGVIPFIPPCSLPPRHPTKLQILFITLDRDTGLPHSCTKKKEGNGSATQEKETTATMTKTTTAATAASPKPESESINFAETLFNPS